MRRAEFYARLKFRKDWSKGHNGLFEGPSADPLALIPFPVITVCCIGWDGKKSVSQDEMRVRQATFWGL
jgi:hypothetical protein